MRGRVAELQLPALPEEPCAAAARAWMGEHGARLPLELGSYAGLQLCPPDPPSAVIGIGGGTREE